SSTRRRGYRETHRRTASWLALRPDSASMRFDEALGDRKAEPGASARGAVRLPEAVKDVRQVLGWNPRTGVRHGYVNVLFLQMRFETHAAARRRKFHGVVEEMRQDLVDSRSIRKHSRQALRRTADQGDVLLGGGAHEGLERFIQQSAQIAADRLDRKTACLDRGYVKQIADEPSHRFDGSSHDAQIAARTGLRLGRRFQHSGREYRKRVQVIAQIVRDYAERLTTLLCSALRATARLPLQFEKTLALALRSLELRNVFERADVADLPACNVHGRGAPAYPHNASVGMQESVRFGPRLGHHPGAT